MTSLSLTSLSVKLPVRVSGSVARASVWQRWSMLLLMKTEASVTDSLSCVVAKMHDYDCDEMSQTSHCSFCLRENYISRLFLI